MITLTLSLRLRLRLSLSLSLTLRRVYDQLETMDAVAFLHRCLEPGSADLIVAADVTVYMRSLEGLMQGAEIYGRYKGDMGEI